MISTKKPGRRQRMDRCQTNLHEQVATQQAVVLPSNQKSEKVKPSAVAIDEFPATPGPVTDQSYGTSNIPVECKPALDLLLRAIKQSQTTTATEHKSPSPQIVVNIPVTPTPQPTDTNVENCSDGTSSDLDQTSVSRKTSKVQNCTSLNVMTE